MGYNLKKMIYEVGGGIRGGRKLKAVVPGGSSTPVLLPEEIDTRHGLRPGGQGRLHARLRRRGGHRRPDLHRRVRSAHHQLLRARELRLVHSLPRRHRLAQEVAHPLPRRLRRAKDIDNIQYLAENMLGRTFCPLGDAAAMPTIAFVKKFRKEFEDHLNGKPCPCAGRRAATDRGVSWQVRALARTSTRSAAGLQPEGRGTLNG